VRSTAAAVPAITPAWIVSARTTLSVPPLPLPGVGGGSSSILAQTLRNTERPSLPAMIAPRMAKGL
jgi:hypothetical protein